MSRRTTSFSPLNAISKSMENVPTKSCRVDVGTWGRRYRCSEDRNRGNITLENIKGIDLSIPFFFVPTSPRLPESCFRPRICGYLVENEYRLNRGAIVIPVHVFIHERGEQQQEFRAECGDFR